MMPHFSLHIDNGEYSHSGEVHFLRPLLDATLKGTCFRPDGSRKVIVDVGSNVGLYSLYFASKGCIVHAFEPLPLNVDHLRLSVRINGLSDR